MGTCEEVWRRYKNCKGNWIVWKSWILHPCIAVFLALCLPTPFPGEGISRICPLWLRQTPSPAPQVTATSLQLRLTPVRSARQWWMEGNWLTPFSSDCASGFRCIAQPTHNGWVWGIFPPTPHGSFSGLPDMMVRSLWGTSFQPSVEPAFPAAWVPQGFSTEEWCWLLSLAATTVFLSLPSRCFLSYPSNTGRTFSPMVYRLLSSAASCSTINALKVQYAPSPFNSLS